METLKTLILYVQKKLGKKKGESEEEIGNYSMNEGQPDKVFGFRREVVKGVVVFFGTVPVLPPEPVADVPVKDDKKPQSDDGKYKSAISFVLSEVNQNIAPTDSVRTESSASKPTQIKSEYFAADESTLVAGTVIPVRLLTGINTELEGQVMAEGMIGASVAAMGSLAPRNISSSNETYTAGQIAAQGAMADLINKTSNLLKDASDIENSVTVEPGYEFSVYVTNNITF